MHSEKRKATAFWQKEEKEEKYTYELIRIMFISANVLISLIH